MSRLVWLVAIACAGSGCGSARGPAEVAAPSPASQAAVAPRSPSTMLVRGPHHVGFRAAWTLDPSRTYRTAFDDGATYGGATGAPRPLLVNAWYPAADGRGTAMSRAAYLDPPRGDGLAPLAAKLGAYARDITAEEVFGAAEASLAPEARHRFDAYLAEPLGAWRGAPPANGRWPVLIYHSGAGSSYAESVELCEHLASHGYVVLGSAYQRADGTSLNIGEGPRDFDALIAWAARELRSIADPARAGGVGHSAGAQALLTYAATGAGRLRALALLDTTQDYHGTNAPMWKDLVADALGHRAAVTAALLVAANPHAIFQLVDDLDAADRTYLTIELDHDQFIGHGVARAFQPGAAPELARVPGAYRATIDAVRAFFDRELRADPAAAARLDALAASPLNGAAPRVERMPRGARRPPAYDPAATAAAPSPRQLRHVLAERGAAATVALLRARRAADPRNPVYATDEYAFALLLELVGRGRADDARAVYGFYRELHPELIDSFVWIASSWRDKFPDFAQAAAAVARAIEPDHPKVRALP